MHDFVSRFFVSFAFDLGRYLLVAAPAFFVFWAWLGPRLRGRWLRPAPPGRSDTRRELTYSLTTAIIFSLVSVGVYVGADVGLFHLYLDVSRHGIPYLFVSAAVLVLVQDAYFYFTHRAMHHRLLFRAVHRVHHLSKHTSPWTAYAFSPIEALVHAAFVPIMLLFMPLHPLALFLFLGFMIVRNVLGHLAIELFPAGFATNPLGRWNTTTTHHALHHVRPATHFGLYFTFWDHMLGTEDPTYEAKFETATRGGRPVS